MSNVTQASLDSRASQMDTLLPLDQEGTGSEIDVCGLEAEMISALSSSERSLFSLKRKLTGNSSSGIEYVFGSDQCFCQNGCSLSPFVAFRIATDTGVVYACLNVDGRTATPGYTFAVVQERRGGKGIYSHKQRKKQSDKPSDHY